MPRRIAVWTLAASSALVACSSPDGEGTTPVVSAGPDSSSTSSAHTPSAPPGGNGPGGGLSSAGGAGGTSGVKPGPAQGDGGARPSGGSGASGTGNGGTAPVDGPAPGGSEAGGGNGAGGADVGLPRGGAGGANEGGSAATAGAQANGGAEPAGGSSGSGGEADPGSAEPVIMCPDDGWNLVWSDEFEGSAGAEVDRGKWNYDSGPNWYNGELQYYAAGTSNASLDGDGNLVIEARRESREGRQYTSARLKTEGKHSFTYGRFEGRMKLPYGQGLWPALWMLGGTSWPNDGEIDIMENLGREPTIAHGTIHGPGYSGASGPGASYTLPDGAVFSDDFHTFTVEWEPESINWYIDGEHYSTKTPADIGGNRWVFDHPFFFIMNVAVGGEWPGNPDDTTVFPQRLLVDYVRVCQR